jgi:O-antigen/teichoic acid export membrane protein
MLHRLRVLASDSLIYGVSGMVTRFLSVWLVPVYTRLFSPEDYGVLSLVTSTVAVFSIFAVLALDNSAARWFWDTDDEKDRKRSIASGALCQLVSASLLGAVLFAIAEPLADRIVHRADAAQYFRLMGLSLPLGQLGGVVVGWLRMQRRPVATTVYTLGTSVLQIALALAFVAGLRWGLRGVYLSQIISLAVGTVVALFLLRDWVSPVHFDWSRLREMLRYAFPLIPGALAMWVVGFADRYFVQHYASTTDVGLYSVGSSLAQGMLLLTGAFQLAWGPFALSIHREPNAKDTYAQTFIVYVVITTFLAAAISLFSPEIIRLLATRQYLGATSVVGLLALGYVMVGLNYIAATGPMIIKTTGPLGLAVTIAAALNLLLNFLLVHRYGMIGGAISALVSQSIAPIALFWWGRHRYPIPYRFGAAIVLFGLSISLIGAGQVLSLDGIVGMLVKLALLGLFIPALFMLDVLTVGRTRAILAAVRSYAR